MIEMAQIIKMLWIPFVGVGGWFFRGLSSKYERLNDKVIRLESTAVTRDNLEEILDKRFLRMDSKIDDINNKLDRMILHDRSK